MINIEKTKISACMCLVGFCFMYYVNVLLNFSLDDYVTPFAFLAVVGICMYNARALVVSTRALFVLFFGFYLAYGLWVETVPFSDYLIYVNDAKKFAEENLLTAWGTSKYPVVSLIYSLAYILGDGEGVTQGLLIVVASALWAIQAVLIKCILEELGVSKVVAGSATSLYSLWPPLFLYTSVISSESVYLLLLYMAIFSYLRYSSTYKVIHLLFVGISLSLAYYSRPIGIFLLPSIVLLVMLAKINLQAMLRSLLTLCIGLVFALMLNMSASYYSNGDISLNSNRGVIGYITLFGTNIANSGRWNEEDIRLYDHVVATSGSTEEKNIKLLKILEKRVISNSREYLNFAFSEKIRQLYVIPYDIIGWSFSNDKKMSYTLICKYLSISQFMAFVMILLFTIVLINELIRREFNTKLSILILPYLVFLAGLYIIFEVQFRYCLCIYPLIYIYTTVRLYDMYIKKITFQCKLNETEI